MLRRFSKIGGWEESYTVFPAEQSNAEMVCGIVSFRVFENLTGQAFR